MRRGARVALIGAGGLAAAVVVAAGVAVAAFDVDTLKPRITDAVQRATGRTLSIGGPLHLVWGLSPGIAADDITFANRRGGSRPQMLNVARAEGRLVLWRLLTGRIEIASITLIRPDLLLEVGADGIPNWQVDRAAPPPPVLVTGSAPVHRDPIVIRRITAENGRVAWHDARDGRTGAADLTHAAVDALDEATQIAAQAQVNGTPIRLYATLGTAAQLMGTQGGAAPAKLDVTVGDTRLTLDGRTAEPLQMLTYAGTIVADIPDLAAIGTALHQDAPALHDLRLNATVAGASLQTASLHIGNTDLPLLAAGATLTQLDASYPGAGQPTGFNAAGTIAGDPWTLHANLLRVGQSLSLRGVDLQSEPLALQGDLAVGWDPITSVRGSLVASHVDVDGLRGLFAPGSPPAAPAATVPAAAAPPGPPPGASPGTPASVFSRAPLPWALLTRAAIDLQLSVTVVHAGASDYRDMTAHALLNNGTLRLDPVALTAPEGPVALSMTADAAHQAVTLTLEAPAFALDPLAGAAGLPGGSDATAELNAALRSDGASPHDLAAHLSGHAGLAVVDGEVSNALLAALAGGPLRAALGTSESGRSHVRCLALRLDATGGQVTATTMKLDSARLEADGTGTADLGAETLALRLRPTVRIGGAGLLAPVRVDGPLQRPHVAMDAVAGGRRGVVLGEASAPPDSCTAELAAARDGRAGRLPAEPGAAAKPPKPADLLRSFLR